MNFTIIIGSPRKKNCYNFSKMIIENIKKVYSNITEEYIFLSDYNLEFCKGCGVCINDESNCPIKDDFDIIKEKILKADFIILASPVFAYRESAIMKNFFDRFHYLHFRPNLFDKKAIILTTAAKAGVSEVLRYLEYTIRGWGIQLIGNYGISIINYYNNVIYKKQKDKEISNLSKKIIKFFNNNKKKIDLLDLIIFNDHKEYIYYYKDKYTKAYEYWFKNNWLKKNYFYTLTFKAKILKFLVYFINFKMSNNKY